MKVQLIKRIRKRLNINPESKSTLVKKEQLLQYAALIFKQNEKIKQILHPQPLTELIDSERTLEEKNITLLAFETTLRQQKRKKEILQNSVKYYEMFIEKNKQTRKGYQDRIIDLKKQQIGEQQKLQISSFQELINKEMENNEVGAAQGVLLNLMKQFIQLNRQNAGNQEHEFI